MFDLAEHFEMWRKQLLASNVYSPPDIEELELHILDAMDDLMENKGLTQEEAFWVAIHRIGDVENLSQEFGKTNGWLIWRRRIVWLLAGYVIISTVNHLIAAIPQLLFDLGVMAGLNTAALFSLSMALRVLLMCGVIVLLFFKKIWGTSAVSCGFSLVKKHYFISILLALTLAFIIRMPLGILTSHTMGRLPSQQSGGINFYEMMLTNTYFNSAWGLVLYIVFSVLLVLLGRDRRTGKNMYS